SSVEDLAKFRRTASHADNPAPAPDPIGPDQPRTMPSHAPATSAARRKCASATAPCFTIAGVTALQADTKSPQRPIAVCSSTWRAVLAVLIANASFKQYSVTQGWLTNCMLNDA